MMLNDDILAIKDSILKTVGDDCEKIYLFGSYAYGTPHKDSDYDFYVLLNDKCEKMPIVVMQDVHHGLPFPRRTPVDVLANYKSRFEWRSTQPTMERKIVRDGILLYDKP